MQLAQREQHASIALARDRMQEVGLILVAIARLIEPRTVLQRHQARIVAGGEQPRAEPLRIVQAQPELDLAIAQHVGIRSTAGTILRQEMSKHLFAVLIGKIHAVQDDAQLGGDAACVLVVLGGGAVSVVLFPVAHEQALHVVAGIAQQQRRDRGVDAAGQANDDALAGARWRWGTLVHAPIVEQRDPFGGSCTREGSTYRADFRY
jgi:hypothetical protein